MAGYEPFRRIHVIFMTKNAVLDGISGSLLGLPEISFTN